MAELFPEAPVSIEAQIACVERELSMRRSVYARRVEQRAMTQRTADREIAVMEAVLATLRTVLAAPSQDGAQAEPVAWRWPSSDGLEYLFAERKAWTPASESVEPLYLAAPPQPAVPVGWKLVPIEPTAAMVKAGWHGADATRCYKAMIDAAPALPKE